MRSQRSFSGRCFHGGIGPRPLEIFQNSVPSLSDWALAGVQSAGVGGSAGGAGPSPLPLLPWHETQLVSASFLPLAALPPGLFFAFSAAGASHGPGAWAHVLAARPHTLAVTTTAVNALMNRLMRP